MLLELAQNHRLLFFGGKGGVGKTTLASATAVTAAAAGLKTLLISTDPAHNLGHLFGVRLGPEPAPLAAEEFQQRLFAVEIDPQSSCEQHLAAVGETLYAVMPEHLHRQVDEFLRLARHSPGTEEAALLERICDVVETGEDYDVLIFDTAPSGHTSRLLALPEMMSSWMQGLLRNRDRSERFSQAAAALGSAEDPTQQRNQRIRSILQRRHDRFVQLRDQLRDPQLCAFVIVLIAERIPVLESVELHQQLTDSGVHIAAAMVNRRSPAQASGFLAGRRAQEAAAISQLHQALPQLTLAEVELTQDEPLGTAALHCLAASVQEITDCTS